MKARVARNGLIIDDVEQEVGAVIEVTEAHFARSSKLEAVEVKKTPPKPKPKRAKTK